jgi:hypothetical protein
LANRLKAGLRVLRRGNLRMRVWPAMKRIT